MSQNALQLSLSLPIGSQEAYLRAVATIPVLTPQEELELAKRLQETGDVEAARQLVLSHIRFVVRIAQGYMGYGLPLMDLVQEGSIGLMKAVKRFDPDMGVRLVTFAVHWIKAQIHEYIIRNWRIVKIATTKAQRKLFFNLRSLKKRLGFTQDEAQEIAKELGVSTQDVLHMDARLQAQDLSLETPAENEEQEFAPIHYLEDKRSDPALQLEQDDWSAQGKEGLLLALEDLDDRAKHILSARWLVEKKATLQTLADHYQVSPERIRQIENQAMKKLKDVLKLYETSQ